MNPFKYFIETILFNSNRRLLTEFGNENIYFYGKNDGSSPAKSIKPRGTQQLTREIIDEELVSDNSNFYSDDELIESDGLEESEGLEESNDIESQEGEGESNEDETEQVEESDEDDNLDEESESDSDDEELDKYLMKKRKNKKYITQKEIQAEKLRRKIWSNSHTYFIIGGVGIVAFIVLFILVLFPQTLPTPTINLLCGGPSEFDQILVVTIDDEGKPYQTWSFYKYVSILISRDLGKNDDFEHYIPYQVHGISIASNLLADQLNEEVQKENVDKYNSWCEEGLTGIICTKDLKQIKLVFAEETLKDECDIDNGCIHYTNVGYENSFDIKDGSCINEYRTMGALASAGIEKHCSFNKTLTQEEIEKLKINGYEFSSTNKILVKASGEPQNYINGDEKKFIDDVTSSIKGLAYVNREGIIQKAEYALESYDGACGGSITYPSVLNKMCSSKDSGGVNIFSLASTYGWPAHKIMTFWYNHHIASFSEQGKKACELYVPKNTKGKDILNYELKSEYNKVKDDDANIISIFSELKGTDRIKTQNDFNVVISNAVKKYGVGTGKGVAQASIALANYLEEENYLLSYSWGGTYDHFGINRHWGAPTEDDSPGAEELNLPFPIMIPLGLDCVGFARWAQHNGGAIITKPVTYGVMYSNTYVSRIFHNFPGHSTIGDFGDIMYRPHNGKAVHARVVIGYLFDYNNVLVGNLAMEAYGTDYGVLIKRYSNKDAANQLKRNAVYSGGDEESDPVLLGYNYVEGVNPKASTPYAIIDYSNCYNAKGPNKDMCIKVSYEEFYKDVIIEEEK